MELVRGFRQLDRNDAAIAGGKGASLGEMTQAGIPVPPGFVILSSAFEQFIEESDLKSDIDAALHAVNHEEMHTVEKASAEIQALILEEEMPKDIAKEIQNSFKKLDAKWVAVRSSATAEDSSEAAWAGQLESYLNTSEKNLLENVKRCWASLFTPRAIFYRFEKKLHEQKISVAVVIQKMVESEKSGIGFSVHPVTQDYNQLIIEAGFGLGEAIVSGSITPDSYVVEKKEWRILDKHVSSQTRALVKGKNGGNEWIELEPTKGSQQVLDDQEILELAKLIVSIEQHYGFPVDTEWAFEKGKFFIVQSRPITTLKKQAATPEQPTDDWEELIRSDFALYNVSVPFHSIQFSNVFLGGPKYEKLLLYIQDTTGYYYENFRDHRTVGNYCLELFLKDKKKYQQWIRFWHSENRKFRLFLEKTKKTGLKKLGDQKLADLLEELYNKAIRWHGMAYNVDAIDTVLNPLMQKVIEKAYPDERKSKQAEIYSKITFPQELSYVNRMQLEKMELFREMHSRGIAQCGKKTADFLKKYYWIDFKWGESGELTAEKLKKEFAEMGQKKVLQETTEMKERFKRLWKEKKEILRFMEKKESIASEYMRIFEDYAVFHDFRKEGQVKSVFLIRKVYNEMAGRLKTGQKLLYYLWPLELAGIARGRKPLDKGLLKKRTRQWYCEYDANGEWKEFFGKEAFERRNAAIGLKLDALQQELEGVPASQGRVIGKARICLSAKQAMQKISEGDILVTGMTMPDFAPAMKKAAAIVTDEGGLTCHAAIISRELGKPCVVGTKFATRLLKDGDLIEVNANHGVVKVLERKK